MRFCFLHKYDILQLIYYPEVLSFDLIDSELFTDVTIRQAKICAVVQILDFCLKAVDVLYVMGYNNIDVRIRLILLIMFNIRFVVSFLLFYTYLVLFVCVKQGICPAIFLLKEIIDQTVKY